MWWKKAALEGFVANLVGETVDRRFPPQLVANIMLGSRALEKLSDHVVAMSSSEEHQDKLIEQLQKEVAEIQAKLDSAS